MKLTLGARRISVEWAVLSAGVTIGLAIAIAALLVGIDPLISNLRRLGLSSLALFVALMLWQVGCRFLRWFFLTRSLGLPLGWGEALLYYGAGLGMTLTPGRIGETVRLWFIQKRLGIPYRRIAALYVADRIYDANAYLFMIAAAYGFRAHASLAIWAPLLAIGVVTASILYPRPMLALLNLLYRLTHRGRGVVLWLRRLFRNTATLFRPRIFLPALALGLIGWSAAAIVMTVALSRMGIAFDPLAAGAIYAAAALTGGATMLPGGFGANEATTIGLLFAAGVPLDAAVVATLATRMTFLWLPVGLGFLILPLALASLRKSDALPGAAAVTIE
jgi:glycosyltransferase 2 family protein